MAPLTSLVWITLPFLLHATTLIDKVVATFDGKPILLSDIESDRKLLPLRKEQFPWSDFPEIFPHQSTASVNSLLEDHIKYRYILSSYSPDEEEFRNIFADFLRKNKMNEAEFRGYLRPQGISLADFQESMKIAHAFRKMLERDIIPKTVVSTDEVKVNFARTHSQKALETTVRLISIRKEADHESILKILAKKKHADSTDDKNIISDQVLSDIPMPELDPVIRNVVLKTQAGQCSSNPVILNELESIICVIKLEASKILEENVDFKSYRENFIKAEYKKQLQLWTDREALQHSIRKYL